MNQALAVVWAQWRIYRNYGLRGGVWFSYIMSAVWYGAWLAAGIATGFVLSREDAPELLIPISGALLLMSLYWQGIPMLMAASGLALELGKLKMYPIQVKHLFGMEVLLRITAALEMAAILIGAAAGLLFNPVLSGWRAFGALPFMAFHLFLSLGLRDAITRVFSKRRIREFAALFFIGLFILPRLLFFRRDSPARKWLAEQFAQATSLQGWPLLPWTATSEILIGPQAAQGWIVMAGWCAVAAVFALWQFRLTYAFDADAARSGGSGVAPRNRASLMERLYRLPSALLADPLGALLEKELRYQLRAPRFRMLFLMSCALGVAMAPAFFRRGSIGPGFLTLAGGYALLMLGEVCVWNTFGFDRSASQLYFLAPVKFSRVLLAKNIAASLWIALAIALISLLCLALRFPVTGTLVAEAAAVTAVAALYLLSAGNYISVNNARPSDPETAMRSRAAGGTQALLLFLYPVLYIPAALAYFARWAFDSPTAFYAVLAVMGAIGAAVYWVALDSVARHADRRKEEMVAALSAGRAAISS